jgi:L-aminopeptidase/D-esterase-like protein
MVLLLSPPVSARPRKVLVRDNVAHLYEPGSFEEAAVARNASYARPLKPGEEITSGDCVVLFSTALSGLAHKASRRVEALRAAGLAAEAEAAQEQAAEAARKAEEAARKGGVVRDIMEF